jgi:hypothetical protein
MCFLHTGIPINGKIVLISNHALKLESLLPLSCHTETSINPHVLGWPKPYIPTYLQCVYSISSTREIAVHAAIHGVYIYGLAKTLNPPMLSSFVFSFLHTGIPIDGKTVFTSDHALKLEWLPNWVAIIGSGYIGLEFSDVYTALGTEVTFIEVPMFCFPSRCTGSCCTSSVCCCTCVGVSTEACCLCCTIHTD